VIAADAGIAERGALLGAAEDLADKGIDIDHQAPVARARAGRPRARQRLAQHAVELADVPERERAQKRPQRRRRHDPVAQDRSGAPRAQQVAVVDAVRAQGHRRDQCHHLRAGIRRARALTEIDALIDQRLDAQALSQACREHDPRVSDRALVIENDPDRVQSDRPVSMHHEGDLLCRPRTRQRP
jgi:hypothetical protein